MDNTHSTRARRIAFIEAGTGGGIGLGLSKSMENAEVTEEVVIDQKKYHTVYEAKTD